MMNLDFLTRVAPDLVFISIGFLVRHYIPAALAGKEQRELLKYLKSKELTKDEQYELKYNLAETRLWIDLHTKICPHINQELADAREETRQLFNNHVKKKEVATMTDEPIDPEAGKGE